MDLSDIIPFLIIIGGVLTNFVGKSVKGGTEAKHKPTSTNNNKRQLPPQPVFGQTTSKKQIPINESQTNSTEEIPKQALELSPTNNDTKQQATNNSTVIDPNYSFTDESSNAPQNWQKAIIAYEIMKTKF